jgi:hypothetical protein
MDLGRGQLVAALSKQGEGYQHDVVDVFPLLAGRRVDILKMDIEGSEYEAARGSEILQPRRSSCCDGMASTREPLKPDRNGAARGYKRWASAYIRFSLMRRAACYGRVQGATTKRSPNALDRL